MAVGRRGRTRVVSNGGKMDRLEGWIERHGGTVADTIVASVRAAIVLALFGGLIALVHFCSGCGSPIRAQANAATIVTDLTITAGDEIDNARDRALDAVEAAHPEPGAARNAALEAEAAHWRPVGLALDAIRSAILAWTQAIALAHAADSGESMLPELVRLAARVVDLYGAIVNAAAELGIDDLPALPAEIRSLVRALGGS